MGFNRKKIYYSLAVAWTAIAVYGVTSNTNQRSNAEVVKDQAELEAQSTALLRMIDSSVTVFSSLPEMASKLPWINNAYSHYKTPPANFNNPELLRTYWTNLPDLNTTNTQLTQLKDQLGVDVVYLLNKEGVCFASSNFGSSETFIGINFKERRYYSEAILGQIASQYGVGIRSKVPGLYFSAPIKLGNDIEGVLVIKVDLSKLQHLLAPYNAFFANNDGVVMLAHQPDLQLHVLPQGNFWNLSPEDREKKYHANELPLVPLTPWLTPKDQPAILKFEHPITKKHNFVMMTYKDMPIGGLTLYSMISANDVIALRRDAWIQIALYALSGYFVLGLLYHLQLRHDRSREREHKNQKLTESLLDTLEQREQQLNIILDNLPLMVVARDAVSGTIIRSNPATQEILHIAKPLIIGQHYSYQLPNHLSNFLTGNLAHHLSGEKKTELREESLSIGEELRILRAQTIKVESTPDAPHGILIDIVQDVTEHRLREEELHRLAYTDSLTRLPNRAAFISHLEHTVSSDVKFYCALFAIDLDDFKLINEQFGTPGGDAVLLQVAKRLNSGLTKKCYLARFTGDEYLVMLETGSANLQCANDITQKFGADILSLLTLPYLYNGNIIHLTTSISVTLFGPEKVHDSESMLKNLDAAMYAAKQNCRGGIYFFDENTRQSFEERATLSNRLLSSIREGSFYLHLQPQFDAERQVVGVESLLRWNDAVLGEVSPAKFIRLAESMHVIIDIDRWVLQEACRVAGLWYETPALRHITFSINISPEFFRQFSFPEELMNTIRKYGAHPDQIMIEITESAMLEGSQDCLDQLSSLKNMGIRVAIDDFGTGNSSLSYLRLFNVNQLKIDQSFVRNMINDERSVAITHFIISLAQSLNYETIAEGVETEAQFDLLKTMGCQHFQGWLFARSLPIEDCANFIKTAKTPPLN